MLTPAQIRKKCKKKQQQIIICTTKNVKQRTYIFNILYKEMLKFYQPTDLPKFDLNLNNSSLGKASLLGCEFFRISFFQLFHLIFCINFNPSRKNYKNRSLKMRDLWPLQKMTATPYFGRKNWSLYSRVCTLYSCTLLTFVSDDEMEIEIRLKKIFRYKLGKKCRSYLHK